MKKLIVIIGIVLLFSGCGKEEKTLKLSQIGKKLSELTLDTLDYDDLVHQIEEDYEKMDTLTEEQITTILGLSSVDYEHIVVRVSKETGTTFTMYVVVEPKKDKKIIVKEKMNAYFTQLVEQAKDEAIKKHYEDRMETEYGNHLIYVLSPQAEKVIEKIKECHESVFPELVKLEQADLKNTIGLDPNDLEDYQVYQSKTLEEVGLSIIVKIKKDHQTEVETQLKNYFKKLEKEWKELNEENYKLVEDRLETKVGDYQVYIISKDNKKVLDMVERYYE